MDDFLTSLSSVGSSALQQAIADERTRLGDLDDYVGTTMDETRGAVVGYHTVYLPVILRP